jgi:HPr kinase/phosphorylase
VSAQDLAVISAEVLFEANREALRWEWIAGHAHPERRFDDAAVQSAQSAADLVGYLNYIHPFRVQIVGVREAAYFEGVDAEVQERRIQRIVTLEPPWWWWPMGKCPRTSSWPCVAARASLCL